MARVPKRTIQQVDDALVIWLHERFFEGDELAEATKTVISLGHHMKILSRGAPELKRAHTAMRGWRRLAPPRTRMSLPWMVTCAIIHVMLLEGHQEEARATAIAFIYVRTFWDCAVSMCSHRGTKPQGIGA